MRVRWWMLLGCTLAAAYCTNTDTKSVVPSTSAGGAGGSGGMPEGLGVGEPCSRDDNCRSGLVCDPESGTCQPGHTNIAGAPCVISAECQIGLYCAGGVCAKAGTGMDGDACSGDGDCASGFRCAIVGFELKCVPEGNVDLGGMCTASTDCYGGLACVDGSCATLPPGVPPFGKPWPGVTCEKESGPVKAHFRVPRGDGKDGDFFRLPFPNDVRRHGGKLDLTGFPTPGADLLGYDLLQRYLDELTSAGGWGIYHSVYFRFSGELDLESFDGNVRVIDLASSNDVGFYYSYTLAGGKYLCDNRVIVNRAQGRLWLPGRSYAVIFLDGLMAKDGTPVGQPEDLAALLAPTPPSDPALAPHHAKYEPLRDYLEAKAIPAASVVQATVFTAREARSEAEALAAAVEAASVPIASQWTRCGAGVASPCPDASGDRACPAAAADHDELHALVELPIFQSGTAPYLEPKDGGDIAFANGAAKLVRKEKVCMALTVPKGAAPEGGWPVVVFAHGTGGHFRSHVLSGVAEAFAKGVDDGTGSVVKAAVLGIDQVQHGPRRNGSTLPPSDLFFNLANPKAARGNPLQGAADQMALLRFVPTVAFDAAGSPTKQPFALSSTVAYFGHSQGATHGAIATPYGAWSGVLFSGQGASLKDALVTKKSPIPIATVMPLLLQDPDAKGKLRHGSSHPAVNVLQHFIDPADPITHAETLVASPPDGHAPRHVFQVYGVKDTYTPDVVQANYAIAAKLGLVVPDKSAFPPKDIGGLSPVLAPASGNVKQGDAAYTAFVREYGPADGEDGHFVVFTVANAKNDALRFLAGALSGIVPRVGG